jgi:hypothetical protein
MQFIIIFHLWEQVIKCTMDIIVFISLKCNVFWPWYTWTGAHLVIKNDTSLTHSLKCYMCLFTLCCIIVQLSLVRITNGHDQCLSTNHVNIDFIFVLPQVYKSTTVNITNLISHNTQSMYKNRSYIINNGQI